MIRTGEEIATASARRTARADEQPDHVVVATGSTYRRDGWQGQTAQPLPGWESGNCVTWDEVVTGRRRRRARCIVLDDLQDALAPLTAVKLAQDGARSRSSPAGR